MSEQNDSVTETERNNRLNLAAGRSAAGEAAELLRLKAVFERKSEAADLELRTARLNSQRLMLETERRTYWTAAAYVQQAIENLVAAGASVVGTTEDDSR